MEWALRPRCSFVLRTVARARGDERLSGKDRGKPDRAPNSDGPTVPASPEKKGRKQRPADVGRALRTVYDDTLRESVPSEFLDLLGKLS
jgi:hypothetical protein